ncbi:hypothetical protein M8J76_002672 [Diaphorina citri]|nr:hypothetical protein M8J76_002672 [Diaphorina citri]
MEKKEEWKEKKNMDKQEEKKNKTPHNHQISQNCGSRMNGDGVEHLHVPPIRPVSLEFGDSNPGPGNLSKTVTIMNAPGVKYIDLDEHNELTRRKDSSDLLQDFEHNTPSSPSKKHLLGGKLYPFAVVLRLRIVCGISALVMGTVAFIEERGQFNLGVGIIAGLSTVIAAASSIHTSRGFSGYKSPSCDYPLLYFRFLGPTIKIALTLTALWSVVLFVHISLLVLASQILVKAGTSGTSASTNVLILAIILSVLSAIILITIALILRIDCMYDPD